MYMEQKEQEFVFKQKTSIWQILFYSSLIVLTIWLIRRLSGIVQTPLWFEQGIPVATLIISILSLYQNLARDFVGLRKDFFILEKKIDVIENDVGSLKSNVSELNKKTDLIESDIALTKRDLVSIKRKG